MVEYNYTQLQAFKFIELISLWEGTLNTQNLIDHLAISRQSASNYLSQYRNFCPANLRYDNHLKCYLPHKNFKVKFSTGMLNEYVALTQGQWQTEQNKLPEDNQFFYLGSSQLQPKAELIQPIIRAIKKQERLDILYVGVSGTGLEERIISPHSLVHDGRRWHARAWCESSEAFRDFVLTRVREVFDIEGQAKKTRKHDKEWNTWVQFDIEPDPRLSAARQEVVALDYAMEKNSAGKYQRHYRVRAALVLYWLQQLRLDIHRNLPEAQQIVLSSASHAELAEYLTE